MTMRHSNYSILVLILVILGTICRADLNRFDCASLATEEAVVDGGLEMI